MDVHMPRLNGYEATRQIMEHIPTPIVMVSASLNQDEVAMTFEALKAGALTVVDKPFGPNHPDQAATVQRLVDTVKLMAEVKVVRRWPRSRMAEGGGRGKHLCIPAAWSSPPTLQPRVPRPRRLQLIAIGASTGGPQIIVEILARLPGNLGVPILIVQHIAPGFTPGLVTWLNQGTPLAVKLAEAGEVARPGTVYLAPDGVQMGITSKRHIYLSPDVTAEGFCPSASYLFHSVAAAYGHAAMGILLTGMGRDGAPELLRLREAGGITIAQDEATSVVFGMPGEAIRLGAAEHVLPPVRIAEAICSLVATEYGSESPEGENF
jgi:two-component system chemotaxis response regulator CheB